MKSSSIRPTDRFILARNLAYFVDLRGSYLIRPKNSQGAMANEPFSSSAAEAHLKTYLKEMRSDNGETLHGFPCGCATTFALFGG